MSRRTWTQWFQASFRGRRNTRRPKFKTRFPRLEMLGERITPAVNAMFTMGTLTVIGDGLDNTIEVSRNAKQHCGSFAMDMRACL